MVYTVKYYKMNLKVNYMKNSIFIKITKVGNLTKVERLETSVLSLKALTTRLNN